MFLYFLLLITILSNNIQISSSELTKKGADAFINVISNSCSFCKLGEGILDNSFPINDFQVILEEKCNLAPKSYSSICQRITGKLIDVVHRKIVDFMKHHDCTEYCGDNTQPISMDYVCIGARYLYENVDNFINLLKMYGQEVCRNEKDVMKCVQKISSLFDIGKGIGKRTILRLSLTIDSKSACGIPYNELPQGNEIFEKEQKDSTGEEIKCIICAELVKFIGKITGGDGAPNTSSIQFLQAAAAALTEVCNKLDLCKPGSKMCTGGTCENFAGSIVNMIPQMLPVVLNKLCHTIDPNCPINAPSS
uniref:Saposin B-type domain-containing protein n=1 Tax=Strongyloides papillosus TaxID=174720 RepID=A0A0N5C4Q2_STREA